MLSRLADYGLLSLILTLASLPVSSAIDPAVIEKTSNNSLLWGPYRPGRYFGVRPRLPDSLIAGLMWAKVNDYQDFQQSMLAASCSLQPYNTSSAMLIPLGN
jgi:hypothetical protein